PGVRIVDWPPPEGGVLSRRAEIGRADQTRRAFLESPDARGDRKGARVFSAGGRGGHRRLPRVRGSVGLLFGARVAGSQSAAGNVSGVPASASASRGPGWPDTRAALQSRARAAHVRAPAVRGRGRVPSGAARKADAW